MRPAFRARPWTSPPRSAPPMACCSSTPEYNWSLPGGLKNAIDWVSRMKEQPFEGKPVAIQSCSQGPLGGARMQYHWRMSMTFLKAFIYGTPEVFVGSAANKFDKETLELKDQPTKDAIKAQLAAFAKFIAMNEGAATESLGIRRNYCRTEVNGGRAANSLRRRCRL